jgi:hypothetical protein
VEIVSLFQWNPLTDFKLDIHVEGLVEFIMVNSEKCCIILGEIARSDEDKKGLSMKFFWKNF